MTGNPNRGALDRGWQSGPDPGSGERFTPEWILDIARATMGGIDLDPASSAEANQIVQATQFYDMDDDGLLKSWHGRIWLNPPYARGWGKKFSEKLMIENPTEACTLLLHNFDSRWYRNILTWLDCFALFNKPVIFQLPGGEDARPWQLRGVALGYHGPNKLRFYETAETDDRVAGVWIKLPEIESSI